MTFYSVWVISIGDLIYPYFHLLNDQNR